MQPTRLPTGITAAFEDLALPADGRRSLLASIIESYTAPRRHYHNLTHLAHLVTELETVRDAVSDWQLLMLAAAYHDVMYDTARTDNEEASAARALGELSLFLETRRLRQLEAIIIATKHHERVADTDTNLFCDADLAILGSAPDAYDRYAAQIRQEYGQYPDALYNPGRAAVLRKLLEQPALYKTASFHSKYEAAARENLNRELLALDPANAHL